MFKKLLAVTTMLTSLAGIAGESSVMSPKNITVLRMDQSSVLLDQSSVLLDQSSVLLDQSSVLLVTLYDDDLDHLLALIEDNNVATINLTGIGQYDFYMNYEGNIINSNDNFTRILIDLRVEE